MAKFKDLRKAVLMKNFQNSPEKKNDSSQYQKTDNQQIKLDEVNYSNPNLLIFQTEKGTLHYMPISISKEKFQDVQKRYTLQKCFNSMAIMPDDLLSDLPSHTYVTNVYVIDQRHITNNYIIENYINNPPLQNHISYPPPPPYPGFTDSNQIHTPQTLNATSPDLNNNSSTISKCTYSSQQHSSDVNNNTMFLSNEGNGDVYLSGDGIA